MKAIKPLSEKHRARWHRLRAGGRSRFVLVHGVLIWGCFTALFFSALPLLFGNSFDWLRTALSFVLFPIGGIGFGRTMWNYMEERYALATQEAAT